MMSELSAFLFVGNPPSSRQECQSLSDCFLAYNASEFEESGIKSKGCGYVAITGTAGLNPLKFEQPSGCYFASLSAFVSCHAKFVVPYSWLLCLVIQPATQPHTLKLVYV
jgi:hypothetical protein